MEAKQKEQAMDDIYDKMINGAGGYRKLRRGEHYEDVQNHQLANEIRIRERREKYMREDQRRDRGYDRGHHGGRGGGGRGGHRGELNFETKKII